MHTTTRLLKNPEWEKKNTMYAMSSIFMYKSWASTSENQLMINIISSLQAEVEALTQYNIRIQAANPI